MREPVYIKPILIAVSLAFLTIFIALPLWTIFSQAFANGFEGYIAAITERDAVSAIALTLTIAAICVPINMVFGAMAAWAIAKFDFRGKNLLVSLIEIPFAVSPVIAGLMFVLLFGSHGWFGEFLAEREIKIVFALPGMVLATLFVTFPFVARELIPVMKEAGRDEEEAAMTLGASGWRIFRRVTLPNIKWGMLYGVILTNARAVGEFGAVAVLSGMIRGETMTMPLHIEALYGEYMFTAAFAVASLLTIMAVFTLIVKAVLKRLS
ncbi:MAG: sulfate ABC transporter permease subunit CysW [Helicobacteraceae bacterium]|jgi:sulfate transport system permease protein|nr:sulfate ABC transporter permease subunit CysW [Helicobacteraceae bacterium]